ncbi:hypothetical protein JYU03_00225 [bacterium AH-315-F03]|nr:hypothetical protein [bacterium AH-315-F03]
MYVKYLEKIYSFNVKYITGFALVSFFVFGVYTLLTAQFNHHDQEWEPSCNFCHGAPVVNNGSISMDFPEQFEISDGAYSLPVTIRLLDTTVTSWSIEVHSVGADPCGLDHQGYYWPVDLSNSGQQWPADSFLVMENMPIDSNLPDSGRKAVFAWMRPWTPSGGLTVTLTVTASRPSGDTTFELVSTACERWDAYSGTEYGDLNNDFKITIGDVVLVIKQHPRRIFPVLMKEATQARPVKHLKV